MNILKMKWVVLCFTLFSVSTCSSQENKNKSVYKMMNDSLVNRNPVYAGSFYPGEADKLKDQLGEFFTEAVKKQDGRVMALIVPHAGYVYSGLVAASAFAQVDTSRDYRNIFILASSHRNYFNGGSIYSKGNFITPLGEVKVNRDLAARLKTENKLFSFNDSFHNDEHSLEVELPFLQYIMKKDFRIVPILIGTDDEETCSRMAEILKPYFNEDNLFVVSTDFSHYPSYSDALKMDKNTAEAITSNSPSKLLSVIRKNKAPGLQTSLCGWTSVLTLLYLTEKYHGLQSSVVMYRNSGDSPYGSRDRVVGYNAIYFYTVDLTNSEDNTISLGDKEKEQLISIAHTAIESFILHNTIPLVDTNNLPDVLKIRCGAFVSIYSDKLLRGCIGKFTYDEPLYRVVQDMAIAAATQDYRFQTVTPEEVKNIKVEISVLTPMRQISSINEIIMGKHGIFMTKNGQKGTLLPQVAMETHWTKEEFLGHCARDKAGIGWDGWKTAELYIYEALVFGEDK